MTAARLPLVRRTIVRPPYSDPSLAFTITPDEARECLQEAVLSALVAEGLHRPTSAFILYQHLCWPSGAPVGYWLIQDALGALVDQGKARRVGDRNLEEYRRYLVIEEAA